MDWMTQLGGLLQQYAGGNTQNAPQNVDNDFDNFTQAAPSSALSQGLAAAFRSQQTPPFGNMVAQLFRNSDPQQRASILNMLISAAGPMVISHLMSRMGGASSGLGGVLSGGRPHVTPEIAEQVPPEAVAEAAAEAEQQNPTVIDQISDFYAQHPTLVKGLGAAALAVALAHFANNRNQ